MSRGFFGVAAYRSKTPANWGSLYRSAQVLGASALYSIGARYPEGRRKGHEAMDTMNAPASIPTTSFVDLADFMAHLPANAVLVAVELDSSARPLATFTHPNCAIYILGAEDDGLPPEVMAQCDFVVKLPGTRSLNVACAGTAVLVHRAMQRGKES